MIRTYIIGDNLYVNVTNRCDANCIFCRRKKNPVIREYDLSMDKADEPSAGEYITDIGDPKRFDQIVFCGYGEPTIRMHIINDVADYVKQHGGSTRLNTNGHGNIINKRNVVNDLAGRIDTVSVSLNSSDPKQYAEIMNVPESYFNEMVSFTKACKEKGMEVIMSIVTFEGVDVEAARAFAEEEVGVSFRIREYS